MKSLFSEKMTTIQMSPAWLPKRKERKPKLLITAMKV